MRDVSLLDAFRLCGPVLGVPEVDEIREAAAARLLEELKRLARRVQGFNADIRDEAAQVVLVRLFKAGPREHRDGDPDSEERLRGFLLTALRNAARDLLPRRTFGEITTSVEGAATNPVGRPDHELEVRDRESSARHLVEDTEARLRDVVQTTAAQLGDRVGPRLLATVEELRAIAEGRLVFDRVVEDELADAGGTPVTVKNRFYKRYSRALERILETVDQLEQAGTLAPPEKSALLAALDRLRLRMRQDGRR